MDDWHGCHKSSSNSSVRRYARDFKVKDITSGGFPPVGQHKEDLISHQVARCIVMVEVKSAGTGLHIHLLPVPQVLL